MNFFKAAAGALAITAAASVTSNAVVNFPFPQNMKSPNGYTIPFADTDMIKSHFKTWMGAWYQDNGNEAWILSPEGTSSAVSEGIAYGMMIMVYMSDNQNDYQSQFNKLWATWKNNSVGANGGMNWRIGSGGGTGSATDADVDAALALVMAYKQWGNQEYLTAAKAMINWIGQNDINGNNSIKPGNAWNDAFNPSYAALANFELFGKVTGDSKWSAVVNRAAEDLKACQNKTSGLVPDWCDWNSHQPTRTSASVAQDEAPGFYDDAARTPWRTAWSYYWYGNASAKAFNKTINDWMIPETHSASGINSGYSVNGEPTMTTKRNFVSSTFSGGMGLAASSFEEKSSTAYMETVYKVLANMTSCATANGCGEGNVKGEKYYSSTLNLLYLLLMTGNMPNFYDMNGFVAFTPDPSLGSSVSGIPGTQMASRDSTVGLSGFWNWGAYHDKLGIGTKMSPDSGSSPLFLNNGVITAEAIMEIGPEPEWTQEAADAGLLKYPSAGIAMSFLSDDTKGVDFTQLGITGLRITMKASGPIRMGILNEKTVEAGGEPGIFVPVSDDYTTVTYDLTPDGYGFKGTPEEPIDILSWVDMNTAPEGVDILKAVKGLKFEVKDAKGGFGSISVKSVEFLNAAGAVVDPSVITGVTIKNPTAAIAENVKVESFNVQVNGLNIIVNGAKGKNFAVFTMQGKVIASGKVDFGETSVNVPSQGTYLVRVGNSTSKVMVK